jgi:outer membrane protein assembly factor BamE
MKLIMSAHIPILVLILLSVSACARHADGTWKAPLVYRIDVQQGNVVDQEMINKLQPGMDKKQVKFIMGTPLITDPFHSDRWDYVYSMEPGKSERQQRRVTLYFKSEKLAYIDGDIKVTAFPSIETDKNKDRVVDVPLKESKEGFFSRMIDKDKPESGQVRCG